MTTLERIIHKSMREKDVQHELKLPCIGIRIRARESEGNLGKARYVCSYLYLPDHHKQDSENKILSQFKSFAQERTSS